MGDPDYRIRDLVTSKAGKDLIYLSVLPLVDGYFLTFLIYGMWMSTLPSVFWGLTALSGAGCVTAAAKLKASLSKKIAFITVQYFSIAIIAIAFGLYQKTISPLLLNEAIALSGLFVLGLGIKFIPNEKVENFSDGYFNPNTILLVMVIPIMLKGMFAGFNGDFQFVEVRNRIMLINTTIAVLSGYSLTVVGALLGDFIQNKADMEAFSWGGGISLILMGVNILLDYFGPSSHYYATLVITLINKIGIGDFASYLENVNYIFILAPLIIGMVLAVLRREK